MRVSQISGLNKSARKFLLENCVSKRGVEVMVIGFSGYINGQNYDNTTLIRQNSKWIVFSTKEIIQSISGKIDHFCMTKATLGY